MMTRLDQCQIVLLVWLLSIVSVLIAFTGSAAAVAPDHVDADDLDGSLVFHGEQFNVNVDDENVGYDDNVYLVNVTRNSTNWRIEGFTPIASLKTTGNARSGKVQYKLNTTIIAEPNQEYAIANRSSFQDSQSNIVAGFEVINQRFDTTFNAENINKNDNKSFIEIDSRRYRYNITVQSNHLNYKQLKQLFNTSGDHGGSSDAEITDEAYLPLNGSFGPSAEDGDGLSDLKDEGVLTLDLSTLDKDERLQGDELTIYPKNLANGEGWARDGEYKFEFSVTDTNAVATDTIYINSNSTVPQELQEDVSAEQYAAVLDGDDTLSASNLADAVNGWADNGEINGVDIGAFELSNLINYWANS